MSIYKLNIKKNNETISLEEFKDKVLLIVNVASKCGFTSQYDGLQKLKDKYSDKDFEILAFPCNQFGSQEPGNNEEIQNFCSDRFGVSFPVMDKIDVNGSNTAPIYQHLKSQKPGLLGSEGIKWNFTKFLVDKTGKVLDRYAPQTTPEKLEEYIEKLL